MFTNTRGYIYLKLIINNNNNKLINNTTFSDSFNSASVQITKSSREEFLFHVPRKFDSKIFLFFEVEEEEKINGDEGRVPDDRDLSGIYIAYTILTVHSVRVRTHHNLFQKMSKIFFNIFI